MARKELRSIIIALALLFVVFLLGALVWDAPVQSTVEADSSLRKFSSEEEFSAFLEQVQKGEEYFGGIAVAELATDGAAPGIALRAESTSSDKYSTTNIQIEGVDEADIIKNDGKYLYVISGQTLYIIDAYPASEMNVVSEIDLKGWASELFLKEDKIIVFGQGSVDYFAKEGSQDTESTEELLASPEIGILPYPQRGTTNYMRVYDVSEPSNPLLVDEVLMDGSYVDSRLIGDQVYVISTKYFNPRYQARSVSPPTFVVNEEERRVTITDMYYPPFEDSGYQFTSVSRFDLEMQDFETETYLLGSSHTLFVSRNNIYLTQAKHLSTSDYLELLTEEVYLPLLPGEYDGVIEKILASETSYWEKFDELDMLFKEYLKEKGREDVKELVSEFETRLDELSLKVAKLQGTAVYRIAISEDDINYEASGFVPGTILNQFSMDEYEGHVRIATTTGNSWGFFGRDSTEQLNHLYILDMDMEVVGSVEDLAKGERVYSARFMGDKAYMVTFRDVDPLFVIDTSNPREPEVLGYLKVSGYSSYLHPFGKDYLVGIGMETEIVDGDRALNQGVKISLFDVSDFANPLEVDKIEIGDRGSSSEALHEHKAVLFDEAKGLLVIPVTVYEIEEHKQWGTFSWIGSYVLEVDEEGLSVRGRITHQDEEALNNKSEEYYNWYQDRILRSLYIDKALYTISEYRVKAHDLDSLQELNDIMFREKETHEFYPYEDFIAL